MVRWPKWDHGKDPDISEQLDEAEAALEQERVESTNGHEILYLEPTDLHEEDDNG